MLSVSLCKIRGESCLLWDKCPFALLPDSKKYFKKEKEKINPLGSLILTSSSPQNILDCPGLISKVQYLAEMLGVLSGCEISCHVFIESKWLVEFENRF